MQNPHRKNPALGRARATLVAIASAAALVGGCQAISGLSDLQVQDTTSTSGGGGGAGAGGAPTTSTPSSTATSSTTTTSTTSTGGSASTSSSSASTGAGGEGGAACTTGHAGACVPDSGDGKCPPNHCNGDTCELACDDGGNEMYCSGMGPGPTSTTSTGGMMAQVTCGDPITVQYACTFTCKASGTGGCGGKTIACPNPTPTGGFFPPCDITCDGAGACTDTTVLCGNGPCVLHCLHGGCSSTALQCGSGLCNLDSDAAECPGVTVTQNDETCGMWVCVAP